MTLNEISSLNRLPRTQYKARMRRWSWLVFLGLVGCAFDVPPDVEWDANPYDSRVDAMVDPMVDAMPGARYTVTVTPGGNGTGTITSDPDGIDCPDDCDAEVDDGTTVTLTATPDSGSTFVGWTGGGCTGTDPCVIVVGADVMVEASFALDNSIIVTLGGNGDGRVTSDPVGIDCGDDCDEAYGPGTMVELTAAVIGDSIFEGWTGGGCLGTGTCMVTTDSAVLVTATFTLNQHTLTVATNGTGSGMVTSVPGGITCPGDCMEDYDSGTSVELTATPIEGRFAGWSGGGCGGTGACTTVLGVDRNVTATFTLITIGNVNSTTANGIYTAPTTIPIQITFSDAVTVTGTPTLMLDSGGVATYGGGSFTNTLTFNYVVATGHASADLDYTATDALSLNGGTIQDALGNNATLTLPAPGAADSLGATKAIVIDAVAPVVSGISGPPMYDDDAAATLTYTVSDVHPGSTSCMFTMGSGTVATCTNTGATVNSMNEGLHVLRVVHTDTAGNVSSAQTHSWTVDTIDPVVSTITGPGSYDDSTSASFTFSVTETNASSTSCTLTAGTGTLSTCTTTGASFTGLNEGAHTLRVIHTDLAGNVSSQQTYPWIVDTVDPVLSTITGPPAYEDSTSATLNWTLTETNFGAMSCSFTMGTGSIDTCTSTGATVSSLNQGAHTLSVSHTDDAGNVSAVRTYAWTVDTIDPVVSTISGPASPSASTSATLTYSVTETNPSSTNCAQTVGTGTLTGCTTTMATFTTLSTGSHTVSVTHTDLAGNTSTAKTHVWSVCPVQTFTFTTPTTGTNFTVPATCGSMEIYAWGAGGGGGGAGDGAGSIEGSSGGGGGFAGGTLAVTQGQVFQVAVGGGGPGSSGAGGTNGGADGGAVYGAGGGGWSGLYSGGTYYLIAGAGGGGGAGLVSSGGAGGPGGGTSGGAGTSVVGGCGAFDAGGGAGGTQVAGGDGGSVGGSNCSSGSPGASRSGGSGSGGVFGGGGGGGGGAGYFGGGGGSAGSRGGGGGGGSSLLGGTLTATSTASGSGTSPGNFGSPQYVAGRGVGGTSPIAVGPQPGGHGLVVIVVR